MSSEYGVGSVEEIPQLDKRLEVLGSAFGQNPDRSAHNFTEYVNPAKNQERAGYLFGYNQIFNRFLARLKNGHEDPRFEVKQGENGEYTTTPEINSAKGWVDMVVAATKIPKEAGGVRLNPIGKTRVNTIYSMGFETEDSEGWIRATAGVAQKDKLSRHARLDPAINKLIEAKHGMLAEDLDANFAGEMELEVKTVFGKVVGVKLVGINDDSGGFTPRTNKDKFNLVINKLRASGLDVDSKVEVDVQKDGQKVEIKRTKNLKRFEDISKAKDRRVLAKIGEGENVVRLSADEPIFLEFNSVGCFLWVDSEGKPYLSAIAYSETGGHDAYEGGGTSTTTDKAWRKVKGDLLEMTLGRDERNSLLIPDGDHRKKISRNQMRVTYDPRSFTFNIENLSGSHEMNVIKLKPKVGDVFRR